MPTDPGPPLRRAVCVCAYTASCVLLHGLLQQHYFSTCRSSWLALFSLDPGPYCELVRRGLTTLQWSPVLLLGSAFPGALALKP